MSGYHKDKFEIDLRIELVERNYKDYRAIGKGLWKKMITLGGLLNLLKQLFDTKGNTNFENWVKEKFPELSSTWAEDCMVQAGGHLRAIYTATATETVDERIEAVARGIDEACDDFTEIKARADLIRCVRRAYRMGRDLLSMREILQKRSSNEPAPHPNIPFDEALEFMGLYKHRQEDVSFCVRGIALPLHLKYNDSQVYVVKFARVDKELLDNAVTSEQKAPRKKQSTLSIKLLSGEEDGY